MDTEPPSPEDESLVRHASGVCESAFDPSFFDGSHIVAAAVRTTDGEVYDGVSLPASIGNASSCAEPVAVGSAVADGVSHDELRTCVAVAYPMDDHDADEIRVVPPCGTCRELLADYGEGFRVVVPTDDGLRVADAIGLLPTRTW